MKKQSIWVFEWRKSVHYWWSYISFSPECKELTSMLDPLLYRWGVPPVVIRCVHWTMQRGVLQTWIKALGLANVMYSKFRLNGSFAMEIWKYGSLLINWFCKYEDANEFKGFCTKMVHLKSYILFDNKIYIYDTKRGIIAIFIPWVSIYVYGLTCPVNCEMRLLIHSQTSRVASLKCRNGQVISSHTLSCM